MNSTLIFPEAITEITLVLGQFLKRCDVFVEGWSIFFSAKDWRTLNLNIAESTDVCFECSIPGSLDTIQAN